jgi:serine/threonine-protein kinase
MPLDRTDATSDALARAVAGQYRLEKEIGRGGMGVVYLAVDEQLDRHVAIKTLPPHLSQDPNVRERFLREGRTAGALSHPGIVPIYSAAERDGVVYFVMRWIDGESLADRLAANGPMSSSAVMALLAELTHALGYAHAQGVVHRDIKAENVLIERKTGKAVITDFGIARVAETQPMTATGSVLGTVQYMSPEQVTGDALDGRSDLYALGILAYHAVTCRFPFERPMPSAVLVAHVNAPPPRVSWIVPDVSPKLERIISRLLEKNPAARFASAETLRNALESRGDEPNVPAALPLATPPARIDAQSPGRANAPTPERLSSADAQQVWARAAELQANTGLVVPPTPIQLKDPTGEAATRGYDVMLVRESAFDAGIDVKYVDRALAERSRAVQVGVTQGDSMQRKPNAFTGSHTRLEYEGSVEGELDADGFEEIADEVRRRLGEMVQVSAVGRTLTITTATTVVVGRRSNTPRMLQITVTSRNGRTTVHAFENLQQLTGAIFGSIMGGVGGGGGGMLMGITMGATQNPLIAFPVWLSTIGAAYLGARLLFRKKSNERANELQQIVERVLAKARDHVR